MRKGHPHCKQAIFPNVYTTVYTTGFFTKENSRAIVTAEKQGNARKGKRHDRNSVLSVGEKAHGTPVQLSVSGPSFRALI